MCGIAAYSPVKGATSNQLKKALLKMKILGLFNESRGEHSCGIFSDGELKKGIDEKKLFKKFIGDKDFKISVTKNSPIIVHTRKATGSAHTEDNAHPFRIEAEDKKDSIVIVHNGVIENAWALCNKYGIDHNGVKVDSKALGMLIVRQGIKVLEEYIGAAALIWTKENEDNNLYVYHGASRLKAEEKEIWEERPLYYIKSSEGIYLSSMPESLIAISEEGEEVEELAHNKVFVIKNGLFTNEFYDIDRIEANVEKKVTYHSQSRPNVNTSPTGSYPNNTMKDKVKESLILRETKPPRNVKGGFSFIYYHIGRFWTSDAELCNGLYYLDKKGILHNANVVGTTASYYWAGVKLRSEKDWKELIAESQVKSSWVHMTEFNYAYNLSYHSEYPIANLDSEATDMPDCYKHVWYFNGKKANITFEPKFSAGRKYTIEDGELKKIVPSAKDDKIMFHPEGQSCCTTPVVISLFKNTNPKAHNEFQGWSFSTIFKNMNEAVTLVTIEEMQALRLFAKEYIIGSTPMNKEPDDLEIDTVAMSYIFKCIDEGTTLEQELGNDGAVLLHKYLERVQANDFSIMEDDEPVQEATDFVNVEPEFETINEQEQKESLIEQAVHMIKEIIDTLKAFNEETDELQTNDTDYAQELVTKFYKAIDQLKHDVSEISEKHNRKDIADLVNRSLIANGTV